MKSDRIGQTDAGHPLRVDTTRLVDTRALIQGSSGSGKSWLVRLLVEKTAKQMPVLIIDLEGEFITLREKIDVVIAGEGGEVAVDVRSAGLLARKLLELKLSAVVSIFDLTAPQKRAYVRSFLESIMAAPRELWSPRLIVLDEAHQFAPESTQCESLSAVIDVASRGRKRGFSLIAATQRLSKLHKDVAAELRNVFVGQTTLDVDVKRALDTLGFPADLEHKRALRGLDHQFYAMGPALSSPGVTLFRADAVATTHPESGSRRSLAPPAPSKAIRQVLGELANLPAAAEQEARDLAAALAKVRQLERVVAGRGAPLAVADAQSIDRAVAAAIAARDRHWQSELNQVRRQHTAIAARIKKIAALATIDNYGTEAASAPVPREAATAKRPLLRPAAPAVLSSSRTTTSGAAPKLGKCERAVLQVLAQHPHGCEVGKLTLLSGYRFSGGFRNSLSALRSAGLIEGENQGGLAITAVGAGLEAWEPLPTGEALVAYWINHPSFGRCERAILKLLVETPGGMTADELCLATGYEFSGGFRNSLSALRTAGVVEGRNTETMKAADVFFE